MASTGVDIEFAFSQLPRPVPSTPPPTKGSPFPVRPFTPVPPPLRPKTAANAGEPYPEKRSPLPVRPFKPVPPPPPKPAK